MQTRTGMTLAELVIALAILCGLSSIVVPMLSQTMHSAREDATLSTLHATQRSVAQYWSDTKLVVLDGLVTVADESNRFHIDWLFHNPVSDDTTIDFDPITKIGWHGPYVVGSTADVVLAGNSALIDGWANLIELQDINPSASLRDVRVVSAGPNGVIDIPAGIATDTLTATDVGDDLYVALKLR